MDREKLFWFGYWQQCMVVLIPSYCWNGVELAKYLSAGCSAGGNGGFEILSLLE